MSPLLYQLSYAGIKGDHFYRPLISSGGGIRTHDLRVMSPTSYHCSTPHCHQQV